MFNPQRKAKVSDIMMEQRSFQLHLQKLRLIQQSNSPKNMRYEQEKKQQRYLNRLHLSKKQVRQRLENKVNHQNHRLFVKLIETDSRPEENPELNLERKHFNNYYNSRKNMERIQGANEGIINRMINQSSMVPPLTQMKKQFKQSKRYARMVRKLPAIFKHQQQFRHDMSIKRLTNSKTSLNNYKKGSLTSRSSTQQINYIEKELTTKVDA